MFLTESISSVKAISYLFLINEYILQPLVIADRMHIHVCDLVYISVDKQMRMDRVNIRPGFIKKYLTGPEWSYFFFYFVCIGMLFCVVVVP